MAYNEELVERLRPLVEVYKNVTERKMFGAMGFMLNGNMWVGVGEDEIMARVGKDQYEMALKEPSAREMDFTGKPLRGFVFVNTINLSDEDLERWIALCADFVLTLPRK